MPNFKRNRRDANEKEITNALTISHVAFWKCPPGLGADLIVMPEGGAPEMVEVKMPGGRLTSRERDFKGWCHAVGITYRIFHDTAEVLAAYSTKPVK